MEEPTTAPHKRKYSKMSKGDFIRIANSSNTVKEIAEKTGYSYTGVKARLRAIRCSNVSLKKCLFQRQPRAKKEKVLAAV